MIQQSTHQLRKDLSQSVNTLLARAKSEDSVIPEEELANLERMHRLANIADELEGGRGGRRWPLAVLLAVALAIMSWLLFARVGQTEIELELVASDIELIISKPQVLIDTMNLSALGTTGLTNFTIPTEIGGPNNGTEQPGGLRIAVSTDVVTQKELSGTVTLTSVVVPAMTSIRVEHMGPDPVYRLSMTGIGVSARIGLHGPLSVGTTAQPTKSVYVTVPRSIVIEPGEEDITLDLALEGDATASFSKQLAIAGLSTLAIDELREPGSSLVRRVSTIKSGTLYLSELGDRAQTLRNGEVLILSDLEGELGSLTLKKNGIAMQVRARVSDITLGWGSNPRSLMPTWLEWLQAQHGLSLLWGSALYIFGIAAGVLRWWGFKL